MSASISCREHILWRPETEPHEPTDTLVLTAPSGRFVDTRVLKSAQYVPSPHGTQPPARVPHLHQKRKRKRKEKNKQKPAQTNSPQQTASPHTTSTGPSQAPRSRQPSRTTPTSTTAGPTASRAGPTRWTPAHRTRRTSRTPVTCSPTPLRRRGSTALWRSAPWSIPKRGR